MADKVCPLLSAGGTSGYAEQKCIGEKCAWWADHEEVVYGKVQSIGAGCAVERISAMLHSIDQIARNSSVLNQ